MIEIINLPEFEAAMKRLSDAVKAQVLYDAAEAGGRVVEGYAKDNVNNVFSGRATNALGNSITVEVDASASQAEARIGPTVIYGRIHELGGVILPVFAKMLHWVDESGAHHFAKKVVMPARPYLRPAMDEHKEDILAAVGAVVREAIERAADG